MRVMNCSCSYLHMVQNGNSFILMEMVLNKNWFSILKATFGSRQGYQMLVVSFVFLRPLLFIPACSFSLLLPPNTEALCVTMLGWNTPLCPAQHSSHICVSSCPEKSDLIETGGSYGERSHAGLAQVQCISCFSVWKLVVTSLCLLTT